MDIYAVVEYFDDELYMPEVTGVYIDKSDALEAQKLINGRSDIWTFPVNAVLSFYRYIKEQKYVPPIFKGMKIYIEHADDEEQTYLLGAFTEKFPLPEPDSYHYDYDEFILR